MDSLLTGSDELIYIQTEKLSLTLKGPSSHPNFHQAENSEMGSSLNISCTDLFRLSVKGVECPSQGNKGYFAVPPLFFEQQGYELIIETEKGYHAEFWHDNLNIRKKITKTGRRHDVLSGIINFGNEIGYSDFTIRIDGKEYLQLTVEVYPGKISYKDDYRAIVDDVTREIYSIIFDFLKKTYTGYQQKDRAISSPVEFFAIIRKIYGDFVHSVDIILNQPHHVLQTTHEVIPGYKIRRTDEKTIRWIEKHPEQVQKCDGKFQVSHALSVKRQISYDTNENRLTKYILQSTARKLQSFRNNYLNLRREEDNAIVRQIDTMIQGLNYRGNVSFFKEVSSQESSSGMSLVFTMAPGYRELYKNYLLLLKGLSITGDVFNISLKDLSVLYEYWCFIKLNSLMKERYVLISQDIIKVHENGLFISLVKGKGSKVTYRNPNNGEKIILSYNPKEVDVPTVTQRPDNVLSLEKQGANIRYEYVFDAKYRINPAIPGSDYYRSISHTPGPETDDINTMHRYRDAIVYQNEGSPFERTMFGAYVLFPYNNESEYENHRFYKSIEKVNIGGLPFLPSAVHLVSDLLDDLIADSPDSAFERATLPRGIEEKLAHVDWNIRDVLVGTLSHKEQLDICLKKKFYHIPAAKIKDADFPIHYVAIYQTGKLFGNQSGLRYYGEITQCIPVARNKITEIPSDSEEIYYRFEIKDWKELPKPIAQKEKGFDRMFTNLFLLKHSSEIPELWIRSEEEYRLYAELKRSVNSTAINDNDSNIGFKFNNCLVAFEEGNIVLYHEYKIVGNYSLTEFSKSPHAVFQRIRKDIHNSSSAAQ